MVGEMLSGSPPSGEHFTKHAPNANHSARGESYMLLELKSSSVAQVLHVAYSQTALVQEE